jgi:UDP-N-acetylmuramyl tripeptide synthase
LLRGRGVDPARITIEADRGAALRDTLDRARAGDLVVLLADWDEAQQAIDQWRSRAGHT